MDNYSKLYWLTRLDGLHGLSVAVILITFLFLIGYYLWYFIEADDECELESFKKLSTTKNLMITLLVFFSLILIFVPTKKEMLFIIAGGETLDYIQKDENIQKIPEKSSEIIIKYLDNKLQELDKKETK